MRENANALGYALCHAQESSTPFVYLETLDEFLLLYVCVGGDGSENVVDNNNGDTFFCDLIGSPTEKLKMTYFVCPSSAPTYVTSIFAPSTTTTDFLARYLSQIKRIAPRNFPPENH